MKNILNELALLKSRYTRWSSKNLNDKEYASFGSMIFYLSQKMLEIDEDHIIALSSCQIYVWKVVFINLYEI